MFKFLVLFHEELIEPGIMIHFDGRQAGPLCVLVVDLFDELPEMKTDSLYFFVDCVNQRILLLSSSLSIQNRFNSVGNGGVLFALFLVENLQLGQVMDVFYLLVILEISTSQTLEKPRRVSE